MPDYRETFARKEVKYKLSGTQTAAAKREAEKHLALGPFGTSTISSLYFDTPEHAMIARSLEKPIYKEKLRLRWYSGSTMEDASAVFLEMKKKFKGIVYKRRVQVSAESAMRLVADCRQPGAIECMPSETASEQTQHQIAREIEALIKRWPGLQPSALIRCDRKAFEEEGELGLRVTFDEKLTGQSLIGAHCSPIALLDSGSIMEIKAHGAYPTWLIELLSAQRAYPSSFSKYGEFYKKQAIPRASAIKAPSTAHCTVELAEEPRKAAHLRRPHRLENPLMKERIAC